MTMAVVSPGASSGSTGIKAEKINAENTKEERNRVRFVFLAPGDDR